ncbi:MAG: hypothetical protein HKP48_00110 [Winogradskyella sp.]|uniref:hypothetical protein n=1 Tax=Winogradskyella sp. TaxID=1883156 RepID=UPI0018005051|nr:hypothetical protein [Winogradskyella sp.]MBT8246049.1 hypothetical protein [Winogradskyella sp.]NNK21719.1 hypothetical protein [Winogradskyella sp.]
MKTQILILSIALLLNSCSANDDSFTPKLPPITTIGANTFGCFVDGALLTPRDGTGSTLGPDSGMSYLGLGEPPSYIYNEISIRDFVSGTGGLLDIHIVDLDENSEGDFIINQSNCEDGIDANPTVNIRCRIWDNDEEIFKWYCSIENAGTITILRYDFDNRIVSGRFNCTMQNRDNPNEMIEITDGRFDIKWDTLPETDFP